MTSTSQLTGDKTRLSVRERVERYFILASVRCANCGDLHVSVETNDRTYSASDFWIESEAEWQTEMDIEAKWLHENAATVQTVLPQLKEECPQTTGALQAQLTKSPRC